MINDTRPAIFLLAKPHIDKQKNSDGTLETCEFRQKGLASNNNV